MSEPTLTEIRDHVAHFSDGSTLAIPADLSVERVEFPLEDHLPPSVIFRVAVGLHPDALGMYLPRGAGRGPVVGAVQLVDSLPKEVPL